ncbi:MAG: hypothetical protein ACLR44_02755 [Clostridia bacterium]
MEALETSIAAFSTVSSTPPTKFLTSLAAVPIPLPSVAKQIEKEKMLNNKIAKETKNLLFIIIILLTI